MPNLHILDHPLIQSKLTRLRDVSTNDHNFRLLLEELTAFMVYEITRSYPLRKIEVETPFERTVGEVLDVPVVLVPILRAGTGMLKRSAGSDSHCESRPHWALPRSELLAAG